MDHVDQSVISGFYRREDMNLRRSVALEANVLTQRDTYTAGSTVIPPGMSQCRPLARFLTQPQAML